MLASFARRNVNNLHKATVFATAKRFASVNHEKAPLNGSVAAKNGSVRPISPDLAIWKFSPTGYLHVGIRITGAMLATGYTAVGLTGLSTCDIPYVLDTIKINAPVVVPLLKMMVAGPLTYHALGGFRQMYSDFTAKGFTQEFQDKTSYVMASTALVSAMFFAFYSTEKPKSA